MSVVLFCIGLVAASILASATLASAWRRNRGWFGYVVSTVVLWMAISSLPLFTPSWETRRFPIDFAHFLANLVALAPFAILPMLFVGPMVMKGVSMRKMVIASAGCAILALPLIFVSGLLASCYVLGDCP